MCQTLRTNPHSSSNIPRHVTLAENWGKPLECWARRTRCVSGSPAPAIRWGLRFLETPTRQSRLVYYVRRPAFPSAAPGRRVAGDEHLVRTRAHMQNANMTLHMPIVHQIWGPRGRDARHAAGAIFRRSADWLFPVAASSTNQRIASACQGQE